MGQNLKDAIDPRRRLVVFIGEKESIFFSFHWGFLFFVCLFFERKIHRVANFNRHWISLDENRSDDLKSSLFFFFFSQIWKRLASTILHRSIRLLISFQWTTYPRRGSVPTRHNPYYKYCYIGTALPTILYISLPLSVPFILLVPVLVLWLNPSFSFSYIQPSTTILFSWHSIHALVALTVWCTKSSKHIYFNGGNNNQFRYLYSPTYFQVTWKENRFIIRGANSNFSCANHFMIQRVFLNDFKWMSKRLNNSRQ